MRQTLQSTPEVDTGTKPYAEFKEYLEVEAIDSRLLQREHILDVGSVSCEFDEHLRNRLTGCSGSTCTVPEVDVTFRLTQPDSVSTVLHFRSFLFSKPI